MTDSIKVNYATIEKAAQDCRVSGQEIDDLFVQLKAGIAPLTESWVGDAKTMWIERQTEWNAALDEMKALLARIATALPQIADGYQQTDLGVKNLFA